jgi:hypothetical protein
MTNWCVRIASMGTNKNYFIGFGDRPLRMLLVFTNLLAMLGACTGSRRPSLLMYHAYHCKLVVHQNYCTSFNRLLKPNNTASLFNSISTVELHMNATSQLRSSLSNIGTQLGIKKLEGVYA